MCNFDTELFKSKNSLYNMRAVNQRILSQFLVMLILQTGAPTLPGTEKIFFKKTSFF